MIKMIFKNDEGIEFKNKTIKFKNEKFMFNNDVRGFKI